MSNIEIQYKYSSENIKDICKIKSLNYCSYCGCRFDVLTNILIDNEHTAYQCSLCRIITRYTPKYNKMMLVCCSELTQKDIICHTIMYIRENKIIPKITDIDKNAIIAYEQIKSPNMFYKTFDNEKHKHLKLFFTDKIDIMNIMLYKKNINTVKMHPKYEINEYEYTDTDTKISNNRNKIVNNTIERIARIIEKTNYYLRAPDVANLSATELPIEL